MNKGNTLFMSLLKPLKCHNYFSALNKTALRAECGTTPESVTTTTTASVTTTIATTTTESTSDQAATEKQAQEQWMVCNSTGRSEPVQVGL